MDERDTVCLIPINVHIGSSGSKSKTVGVSFDIDNYICPTRVDKSNWLSRDTYGVAHRTTAPSRPEMLMSIAKEPADHIEEMMPVVLKEHGVGAPA